MNAAYFPAVDTWTIPDAAMDTSLAELAIDGAQGNEGAAMWLGERAGGRVVVTHVVRLRGPGIVKQPRLLRIAPDLLNDVADLAIDLGVSLVGQIHSHGGSWLDLSDTDRTEGIAVPSYLSVVAPWFGLRPGTRLCDCGVHIFDPAAGWRRLSPADIAQRIHSGPFGSTPVMSVGGE